MVDMKPIPSSGYIVVIDDEEAICSGCSLVLTDQGYTVDTFLSGKPGLDAILQDSYDLVLLDLKLPDMEGMEILKHIRRDKSEMNVIIMTGYASVENAVDAMKQGAFDYLSKPFSDDELILTVKKAIQNKQLTEENLVLRKQLFAKFDFSNIIGENTELTKIFYKIRKAAPTDSTILLEGESGTGKELFANAIHAHSNRATKQFVVVDCSTFSSSLLESELFGHVKGAFTGAMKDKAGVFEIANGGTLFLDEIANLNLEVQGKLLRTMETRQYKPVGGDHIKTSDMRIIGATNQNLKTMVENNHFREDLFYRLNVLPIVIPPLRDRKDDIPKLAYHFLRIFSKEMGRRVQGFSDDALEAMIHYDWPGNIRQLKNVVERLVIMCDDDVLGYHHLSSNLKMGVPKHHGTIPETLAELKSTKQIIIDESYAPIEKAFLLNALKKTKWNITQAAKQVGMQRSNFSSLMKKHHLSTNS
jgi:DNA-binding NtrC family response regulator